MNPTTRRLFIVILNESKNKSNSTSIEKKTQTQFKTKMETTLLSMFQDDSAVNGFEVHQVDVEEEQVSVIVYIDD